MAPMPAPMPIVTAMRASSWLRPKALERNDANPALICAVGPSRPPDPPEPIVIADATIFTNDVLGRMPLGSLCTAAIAASVPWPAASGANRSTSRADTRAPDATTRGIAQARAIPVVGASGALVSALLVDRFAPEAAGHGTDAAIAAVHNDPKGIRPKTSLV